MIKIVKGDNSRPLLCVRRETGHFRGVYVYQKKHYVVYVHRIHVTQAHLHTQGAYFNVVIVVGAHPRA